VIVVFSGPSLELAAARASLDADYRPPVANGDVVRAVRSGARVIGIVDGAFEWTLAVWHKEILWALAEGVHVLGAASMGALRAAELAPFGMRGDGRIYELYRDGVLEDDDEVAVVHEPGDGYMAASNAMVDIRFTLRAAARASVITDRTRRRLAEIAKSRFYPDRHYASMLAMARSDGLPASQLDAFEAWLPANRVEQKRADALELIRELRQLDSHQPEPFRPQFTLASSSFLERLLDRAE
jgi:hypothetical protein